MSEANGTKRKLEDGEENENKKTKIEAKEAGVLLFSGLTNYEERNDNKLTKSPSIKWSPHRFETLEGVRIRDVSSGPVSYFFLAISDSGQVYGCGLNQKGQLGMDDYKTRRNPTLIESLSGHNVIAVATGRQHGLFLTDEGQVFACGDNKSGQCGIGNKKETVSSPTRIDYSGTKITKIACGADFSLILNEDGEVYSFGHPEYGQLGLGSENKEIAARKEVYHCEYSPMLISSYIEYDADANELIGHGQPKIAAIACGVNHSCAIDDQQRLFTWGFGGYGRLGHNSTRNELVPRLMKCWYRITGRADGGVTNVYCGGQFTMVQTVAQKCTLMFGQFRIISEANMYPKFLSDLQGWNVRHVVCNQQGYITCADDAVIASQPSPAYGTLALGETKKSSAAPSIVTTLKDVYCHRVGIGYMHSLYIARDESKKDKTAIEKFPTMKLDDDEKPPVVEEKKKTKKKQGKKK